MDSLSGQFCTLIREIGQVRSGSAASWLQ